MSDEQSIRDEIERAFNEWWNAPHSDDGSDLDFSEYIMPLVRRAQAEALREAARGCIYPIDPYGWFDQASVSATRIQITHWLRNRADRIEQEAGA